MWRLRRVYFWLHAFLRSQSAERELAREISSHLALLEDEFRRRGLNPDEARAAARRQMVAGGASIASEVRT